MVNSKQYKLIFVIILGCTPYNTHASTAGSSTDPAPASEVPAILSRETRVTFKGLGGLLPELEFLRLPQGLVSQEVYNTIMEHINARTTIEPGTKIKLALNDTEVNSFNIVTILNLERDIELTVVRDRSLAELAEALNKMSFSPYTEQTLTYNNQDIGILIKKAHFEPSLNNVSVTQENIQALLENSYLSFRSKLCPVVEFNIEQQNPNPKDVLQILEITSMMSDYPGSKISEMTNEEAATMLTSWLNEHQVQDIPHALSVITQEFQQNTGGRFQVKTVKYGKFYLSIRLIGNAPNLKPYIFFWRNDSEVFSMTKNDNYSEGPIIKAALYLLTVVLPVIFR